MQSKRVMSWFGLVAACLALTAFAACGGSSTAGESAASGGDGSPIKIAVVAPYSGTAGSFGEYTDDAFAYALEKYGKKVGDRPIELVRADSKCTPSTAVQAVNQTLPQNPVAVYSVCSGDTLALKPVLAARKIPMVAMSWAPEVMADDPEYLFNVTIGAERLAAPLAARIAEQGAKTVGFVHDNTSFGVAEYEGMAAHLEENGLKEVARSSFDVTDTDYSGHILRVMRAGADALYLASYPEQVGRLVRQARQLGVDVPVYANFDFYDPVAFKAAGKAAEGVEFVAYYMADSSPASKEIGAEWEERFGYEPLTNVMSIYDAVATIVAAVHAAGPNATAESVTRALKELNEEDHPTGPLSFASSQHWRKSSPIYIGTIRNGEPVVVDSTESVPLS